eukprot:7364735-Pyramimonas_sp.AAC.1
MRLHPACFRPRSTNSGMGSSQGAPNGACAARDPCSCRAGSWQLALSMYSCALPSGARLLSPRNF